MNPGRGQPSDSSSSTLEVEPSYPAATGRGGAGSYPPPQTLTENPMMAVAAPSVPTPATHNLEEFTIKTIEQHCDMDRRQCSPLVRPPRRLRVRPGREAVGPAALDPGLRDAGGGSDWRGTEPEAAKGTNGKDPSLLCGFVY